MSEQISKTWYLFGRRWKRYASPDFFVHPSALGTLVTAENHKTTVIPARDLAIKVTVENSVYRYAIVSCQVPMDKFDKEKADADLNARLALSNTESEQTIQLGVYGKTPLYGSGTYPGDMPWLIETLIDQFRALNPEGNTEGLDALVFTLGDLDTQDRPDAEFALNILDGQIESSYTRLDALLALVSVIDNRRPGFLFDSGPGTILVRTLGDVLEETGATEIQAWHILIQDFEELAEDDLLIAVGNPLSGIFAVIDPGEKL
jgi:hypothetical protein